ncbi:nuclear transport factor 2 family protein [Yinghuangia sp. ASG 101]|uniref:nuclear transport factor 2 family protein n=1 Tax=Yinghuangia sp. ASG 101 TaxID=2896848 RepID=UPI001E2C4304|nr:nuclear transport factor 2 family protein [Yinghuangia sp. ASG 101]UGQ11421.1 nuclear transport factor 2 family protein [Yinghuangia sp. ASG 101]
MTASARSAGPAADRLALRDLAESYAAAVGARDAGLLVSLFTEDAVVRVHRGDRRDPTAVFDGASALPGLTRALAARYAATFHIVGNHRARVTGDTARAEASGTAHHLHRGPDGTPYDLQMLVRYEDTCTRGTDGHWRFRRRVVTSLWHSLLPAVGSLLDRADG